jgi:hypothetical protein
MSSNPTIWASSTASTDAATSRPKRD